MPIELLIFLAVFTPALVGGLNLFFDKNPNVRDTVTLLGALLTFYFNFSSIDDGSLLAAFCLFFNLCRP